MPTSPAQQEAKQSTADSAAHGQSLDTGVRSAAKREDGIYPGTGRFINHAAATATHNVEAKSGDITLNFVDTDIREVVKVVIGDLLGKNYAIDPEVKGPVSLQTSSPIDKSALLPMLESLLRMHDAALVDENGLYKVTTLTAGRAALSPRVGKRTGPGYGIQVVPLHYIAAQEMEKILKPMVPEGALLLVDQRRNLIMLAGSSRELQSWLTTVDIFDVDWMKGNSVGLFTLENSDAKTVTEELKKILGDNAGDKMGDMIRVEPLERLNAVLIVTPQKRYLSQMKTWIDRLDRVGTEPGVRLFVYQVKNRKAADLAAVIGKVFSGQGGTQAAPAPVAKVAPGLKPVQLEGTPKGMADTAEGDQGAYASSDTLPATPSQTDVSLSLGGDHEVQVVADEPNNSVLVLATAGEYKIVEAALRRLDVQPLQVLVEASIVEVTLSDELSYGLEWFFKNGGAIHGYRAQGLLDLHEGAGIGSIVPGFSYAVVDAANTVRGVLNALASESKLHVLSSPSLMVLDNSKAKIKVGEQVPIKVSGERRLFDETSSDIAYETYEYKDTGVMLTVTPRVNAGGLVTMDIGQDVTDIGNVDTVTGQRKFLQRTIESQVAVQDGQTIVLGGLILDNTTVTDSGVPVLHKVPVLGNLFGGTTQSNKRTELVVLMTPRVVRNQQEAEAVTEEFRKRMQQLQPPEKPTPPVLKTKTSG